MSDSSSAVCVSDGDDIQNPSLAAFITALVFNTVLSAIFLCWFYFWRPRSPKVYVPRQLSIVTKDVPKLPYTHFSWLPMFWKFGDDDILSAAGLDAMMIYRVVKMFAVIFLCFFPYGVIVLIPLNVSGGKGLIELDALTLGNIDDGSAKMIAHAISVLLFTVIVMILMHREYKYYVLRRQRAFLLKDDHCHSALVKDIPKEDLSEGSIANFFNSMFPDKVKHVVVHKNPEECEDLFQKREVAMRKLERALWTKDTTGEEPQHRLGFLGLFGEEVKSVPYWTKELNRLNEELAVEQKKEKTANGAAFVTFTDMESPSIATQVLVRDSEKVYQVRPAPQANNVYWPNMGQLERYKPYRSLIIYLITWMIVMLYMIPIAFIQSLTNLCALEEQFSWITPIIDAIPLVRGILEGVMPTLILTIFLAILPLICRGLTILEGKDKHSDLEKGTFEKLFYFYVINVFIGSTVAGGALATGQEIVDDFNEGTGGFNSVVDPLTESLPGVANFFINFIMLKTAGSFPGVLADIAGGAIYWIKMKWLAKTPRERAEVWFPKAKIKYAKSYGDIMLVFIIGVTYASMASLIIPFCILYYVCAMFTFKYEVMYVSQPVPDYEGYGEFFPMVFNRTMASLILYQVVMFGYLGAKGSGWAFVCLPTIIATILYWRFTNKWYSRPAKYLPLNTALVVDEETQDGDAAPELRKDTYVQECLRSAPTRPFGADNPFAKNFNTCHQIEKESQANDFSNMWGDQTRTKDVDNIDTEQELVVGSHSGKVLPQRDSPENLKKASV
ncbi:hypothetical protein SARC_05107 [Sphaeroforma arctica JP610]|uniref:CSC1/OSCA1-like 7TM region domain-containing protein n=1 Tax=Sphaeroforma arctica JP610 TaxID=667725 RepID=A0A0L0G0N0_9EUKA|nr:hypothetical protein SARC_05107 [Sphaeroforma arctica JP610]KNC82610.1 hypothetical protein SARC_05107 [Sphaeroforma arctica JP610]|eukprot:XP_014156512.1 hypothetical protein SARC_05107 [Sphaeroforma arctica JP610]